MGCFLIGVTGKGFSKTGEALLGSVSDDPYDVRTKSVTHTSFRRKRLWIRESAHVS